MIGRDGQPAASDSTEVNPDVGGTPRHWRLNENNVSWLLPRLDASRVRKREASFLCFFMHRFISFTRTEPDKGVLKQDS